MKKVMNKTQNQFLRLGDYITKKMLVEQSSVFSISDNFKFVRYPSYYMFRYYNIYIIVNENSFKLKLPSYIDITEFDKSRLLKDMWHDVINYNPVEQIMNEIAPILAKTFADCGRAFIRIAGNFAVISNKDGKEKDTTKN